MTTADVFSPQPPAIVLTDVPCRRCQYNLRGLPLEGRCPECGTPVGLSTYGDLLRYSNPDWVFTLHRGVQCILWGILLAILVGVAGAVLMAVLHQRALIALMSLIAPVLSWAGGWFLTTPDPSGLGEDQYGTSRKVIRITLVFGIVQQIVNTITTVAGMPLNAVPLLSVAGGLAGLVNVVGQFAMLNYLAKLARRVPDEAIAARAQFLKWAYGVSYGALVLFGAFAAALFRYVKPSAAVAPGCFVGLAGLAVLVFGIMYLLMLSKLGQRFKEAGQFGRSGWAAAVPPG